MLTSDLPFVPYALPAREDWNGLILVGEAPGAEEVKQGKPFVGRSGQLLNERLKEAGIDRTQTVVANVFRYQPPGNKVDHFFSSRRAAAQNGWQLDETRPPFGSARLRGDFSSEINALKDLLQTWQPTFVVALGRTPFWALCGGTKLLTNIGQTFDCALVSGIPVLPTYHPSFVMRGNWGLIPAWQQHFVTARQHVA